MTRFSVQTAALRFRCHHQYKATKSQVWPSHEVFIFYFFFSSTRLPANDGGSFLFPPVKNNLGNCVENIVVFLSWIDEKATPHVSIMRTWTDSFFRTQSPPVFRLRVAAQRGVPECKQLINIMTALMSSSGAKTKTLTSKVVLFFFSLGTPHHLSFVLPWKQPQLGPLSIANQIKDERCFKSSPSILQRERSAQELESRLSMWLQTWAQWVFLLLKPLWGHLAQSSGGRSLAVSGDSLLCFDYFCTDGQSVKTNRRSFSLCCGCHRISIVFFSHFFCHGWKDGDATASLSSYWSCEKTSGSSSPPWCCWFTLFI